MASDPVVWKHIGLHGHSVGTFACNNDKIIWKSAITGRDDDVGASTTKSIPATAIQSAKWSIFGKSGYLRLSTKGGSNLKHEMRFDGFPLTDFDTLKSTLESLYNIELQPINISSSGTQYGLTSVKGKNLVFRHCVLDEMNEEGQEFEPRAEDEMMSLDLAEVTQAVLPGNNRNEIELQFPESDAVEAGTDQLVSIRFYIPPDPEVDKDDKETPTRAEELQQTIMQTANIRKTTGDVIVSFDEEKGTFLTPRGRYRIELYDYFLRMRGQKYDYKIKYDDINRLFLLPKPDGVHMAFVIALDKPIRQGQQRYQYLVLQATKDPEEVTINLDENTLQKEYEGELQPVMRGALSNLIAKTFKVIAKKKVFIPGKFTNAAQEACVKCAVRANEGLLYPLEKQFVFIHKPPIIVRFNEVESVEFQRYAGGQGSTRNFDLCVNLKSSVSAGGAKEYIFSGIDRSDYASLYDFLSTKKIVIKNIQGVGLEEEAGPVSYNEDELLGPDDGGMAEDSEDEDFDEEAAQAAEEEGSDSDEEERDDDELGSEVDDDIDSDLESPPKAEKKEKKAKASPKKRKKKDPNAPKRPMSSYLLFSTANREKIKAGNPDATFGDIAKLVSKEFNALSPEEKAKWDEKAAADKQRYEREMADYSAPEDSDDDDDKEDSKPSKKKAKKAKKDPNAPKRGKTAFLYYSTEIRAKVKEENPDLSFGELGKKIGEMYKALSEDEKAKYVAMAEKDKERYEKAMTEYKAKGADEGSDEDEEAEPKNQDDEDGLNDEIDSDSDSD